MNTTTIITLLVLGWIIIGFMSGKWSMGTVAMTGLVLLEVTGVLTFEEAFAYVASNNVIMVASTFILSGALQKTSLVTRLRHWMLAHAKNGTAIVAMYLFACFFMVQFVMPTALVAMLLPFMNALDKDSEVQPSNLLFPGVVVAHAAQSSLPLGNALTGFVTLNAILEANGAPGDAGPFSTILVAFIPAVLTYLYYVFVGWKLYPKRTYDTSAIKEYKDKETTIPKWQETLIYVVFIATMVLIVLKSALPKLIPVDLYMIAIIADIILCLTKCMSVPDVRNSMNMDTLFMLIGVLPLGTAMQKTGAAEIVGNTIVKMLGGNPSYPVFLLAFMVVGGILTQFMSNSATNGVFRPLAIITAVTMGYNATGIAIACGLMTTAAMLTPMGSPSLAIAYGAGQYNQKELLKANLPAFVIHTAAVFVMTLILYPA
ncbi:MAG: hypothetical protein HFF04_03700 [Oscillospiraceae bacterium]|nr:hypothetical protein [Oscillospiraceae bacterium]